MAAVVFNHAINIERQGIRRGQVCVINTHADAAVCPFHVYFIGIHGTQRRYIQRDIRAGTGVIFFLYATILINTVITGNDVQLIRLQFRIDLHGASDNVGVLSGAGVHTFTGNRHLAFADVQSGYVALIIVGGGTRGERSVVGVNKTATVAGNT